MLFIFLSSPQIPHPPYILVATRGSGAIMLCNSQRPRKLHALRLAGVQKPDPSLAACPRHPLPSARHTGKAPSPDCERLRVHLSSIAVHCRNTLKGVFASSVGVCACVTVSVCVCVCRIAGVSHFSLQCTAVHTYSTVHSVVVFRAPRRL